MSSPVGQALSGLSLNRVVHPRTMTPASEGSMTETSEGSMTDNQQKPSPGLYQYTPIDNKQIRIFTLHPNSSESYDRLQGSIAVEHRSEPDYDDYGDLIRGTGSYEALSYTWGSDDLPCDILVEGSSVQISANLHEALLRLRLPDRPRRLWIDAICINQSDDDEKTGQVQAMWQIFGDATTVLVWLGEDSALEDGRKCFTFCKWAAPQQTRWDKIRDDRRERFTTVMDCFNAEASAPPSAICLEHVEIFFSRAWFRRLWIIQEFSLASDVQIHCGRNSINAQSILWLMKHSYQFGPKFLVRFGVDDGDDSYWHMHGKGQRLMEMVDTATTIYGFECKDPRDRVAALVSISNANRNSFHPFSIDYSTAVERNYIRFAQYLLRCVIRYYTQVRILVLAATRHSYGLSEDRGLPSWVPDWRKQPLEEEDEDEIPRRSRSVEVVVLLAVGYEVQVLDQTAIRLRLMVSDDPNTTMMTIQTSFEQGARDSRGNGCWKIKSNHLEHGDLVCYFASHRRNKEGLLGNLLALRKSRTHQEAWVIINARKSYMNLISHDRCMDQLRENYECFTSTLTAIELTVV